MRKGSKNKAETGQGFFKKIFSKEGTDGSQALEHILAHSRCSFKNVEGSFGRNPSPQAKDNIIIPY